jgi:gliding motility-associated-like protein
MAYMLGTKLLGANSVFKDNEWSKAGSILLWMGPNCVVDNNLMFDTGYAGNSCGAISFWAQDGGQKITRNTIYNQGRGAIFFGYVEAGLHTNVEVGYNHFYNYGMLNGDGGASYAGNRTVLTGLNYHHNWIHDNLQRKTPGKGGSATGIYFDQASGGGQVHHNVVWGNPTGDIYHQLSYNGIGPTINIYNNTFASTETYGGSEYGYKTPDTNPRDVQRNNIYRRKILVNWESGNIGNNQNYVLHTTNPLFVGSGGGGLNYRVQSGSPAVNAGVVIPGITDGSVGAPDIGAYEVGGEAWVPGYKPAPFVNPGTNRPPTGAITAPANNATFTQGSAITVTASANDDDGSVAKVEFFSGTTKLGEDATFPYSYVWNGAAAGTHSLTVRVTDDQNDVGTSAAVSITVNTNPGPTVAITAPANNASFAQGSPITITANASDANGSVTRVEFFRGTTKIGEDLSAPYSFSWNNAAAGNHSLTAKATDNLGGVATSAAVSITVNATTNTAPTVAITSPSDNAQFQTGATITISATATDANGSVAKVEFFYGTTKLGEDLTVPYSFTWTNAPIGTHAITAKATDNQNSVATSAAMDITVATNAKPVVSITGPANNAQFNVGAAITITATATDAGGSVTKVEFFDGTTKLGEDLTSPYSFAWGNATAGSHSLTAKATDNQNNVTTSSAVVITVGTNSPPVVSITAPTTGAQVISGTAISITATASDANGTVAKVEFFRGTTKLGEDLTSPYNFNWNNAPAGNHALTAKATDNLGATSTSAIVNVSVVNPVGPTVDAGEDQFLTLPDNSATLTSSVVSTSPVEYSWTQVEGPSTVTMSSPTNEQLILGDLIEGTYVFRILVTDGNGLTATDEISVTVVAESEATAASIPRFFSPNDDGTGDFWEWKNVEAYENSRLTIFNRAGQQVYETQSYNNTWDGKLDGQPLADGDYYYVIQLANLTDIRGAVRIIR